MTPARRSDAAPAGRPAAALLASIGALLVVGASLADHAWFDRHFLPSFFLPRLWYVRLHAVVRASVLAGGAGLVLGAREVADRLPAAAVGRIAPAAAAALLALGAAELTLRFAPVRPTGWLWPEEEPRRVPDARLGWRLAPDRTGRATIGGRTVEYAIDRAGYRVATADAPVDPAQPAALFIGESIMFGEGLTWEESVPAQVGRLLGVQSANLAVHGYGTDQAYLRLEQELPRFRRPVAVVALFMPALFGRNLDDDRPHLGPGLVWEPAVRRARLAALAAWIVPYRRDQTVERGIRMTRDVLRATGALSAAHGAAPLVVIPQFGAEEPVERSLRRRVLDDGGVPYTFVEVEASWRLPWDRHPNAAAARAIARAIAERLREAVRQRRLQGTAPRVPRDGQAVQRGGRRGHQAVAAGGEDDAVTAGVRDGRKVVRPRGQRTAQSAGAGRGARGAQAVNLGRAGQGRRRTWPAAGRITPRSTRASSRPG